MTWDLAFISVELDRQTHVRPGRHLVLDPSASLCDEGPQISDLLYNFSLVIGENVENWLRMDDGPASVKILLFQTLRLLYFGWLHRQK